MCIKGYEVFKVYEDAGIFTKELKPRPVFQEILQERIKTMPTSIVSLILLFII